MLLSFNISRASSRFLTTHGLHPTVTASTLVGTQAYRGAGTERKSYGSGFFLEAWEGMNVMAIY
eukprot:666096-Rhodomonas_salina.1